MKPSESKVYVDLIKSLREHGVKEMKVEGFQVTFEPGEAVRTLAPAIGFAPPTSQQLETLKAQAEETAFEERADEVLAQLQIDDPEAFEDALIQQELEASEPEDENPITFD